jgi:hypothetical protein
MKEFSTEVFFMLTLCDRQQLHGISALDAVSQLRHEGLFRQDHYRGIAHNLQSSAGCFALGLRIRIHFIRIRIKHFRLNTDLDPGL